VGSISRSGPQGAALANGTAALALDYDDVSFWMRGHPSAVVVPAVLAIAELRSLDGGEIVAALVAGYDAAAVVGLAVGVEHYVRGWHATGTVGAVAAAAAAGRALRLDDEAMGRALGLGALQAGGTKAIFGTPAKPLHGGRAAASGVLAALLAERGLSAPHDALEAADGFAGALAPDFDADRPAAEMGKRLGLESIAFKEHPACGGTHAPIDSLRAILRAAGTGPDAVAEVELRVTREMLDICCIEEPRSGDEAMFSVRHAAALVLAGRSTGLSGFTDEAATAAKVVAARERVLVTVHPARETGIRTEVRVRFVGGEVAVDDRPERIPVSDGELAQQRRALEEKFYELTAPVVGDAASAEIEARVGSIATEADVRGILALTARSRP
jgi:2-methylcitrate dehydratase PrpD